MTDDKHTYHFDFFKDRVWMWALVLPLGFLCWLMPFILLWGLIGTGLETGTSIIIALLMLGVPAYLIGWIIIYSYMEGVITRVTFTDNEVRHRTPWLIFPLIWVTRRISIAKIEDIAMNIPYGSRTAIYFYFHEGQKMRKFYLPRFRNQPEYLEEFRAINARLPHPSDMLASIGKTRTDQQVKMDMLAAARSKNPVIHFWHALVRNLSVYSILGVIFGAGLICLQLPIPALQALSSGMSGGFLCMLISFIGTFPILSQVLIWFFARQAINIVFLLVGIHPETIFLSTNLNKIMQVVLFQPGKNYSLADLIFWAIFILSIFISVDRMVSWLLRIKLPEKNKN